MIQNDISYYAMHTNFDAAPGCMADLAGERLGLKDTRVLELMGKTAEDKDYGIGIYGCFGRSMTLRETAEAVKKAYGIPFVTVFGNMEGSIRTAAICPGAGGSTLKEALKCGADVYITGDIGHHEGIDAVANDMAVIDAGHYGIEHIFTDFMEKFLGERLGERLKVMKERDTFPNCVV